MPSADISITGNYKNGFLSNVLSHVCPYTTKFPVYSCMFIWQFWGLAHEYLDDNSSFENVRQRRCRFGNLVRHSSISLKRAYSLCYIVAMTSPRSTSLSDMHLGSYYSLRFLHHWHSIALPRNCTKQIMTPERIKGVCLANQTAMSI